MAKEVKNVEYGLEKIFEGAIGGHRLPRLSNSRQGFIEIVRAYFEIGFKSF